MNKKEFFEYIENVDIKEDHLVEIDEKLLEILLKDNSTKKNIIWATDDYEHLGYGYCFEDQIKPKLITKLNGNVIKPRTEKSKELQQSRSKNKAEVFTPSWVCNLQNNLVDNDWFGKENTFNFEVEKGWKTNHSKVEFPNDKKWTDYVQSNRLEITCGEAPYLVSRYDTVSGNFIPVIDRIGLLDRKLRIISENKETEQDWLQWAEEALKSTYGYEWQGDNVLLARENLLYSVIDFFDEKFKKSIDVNTLLRFAEIISWNIWQMDGLKFVVPNSCIKKQPAQISWLDTNSKPEECEGCKKNDPYKHTGVYSMIMDWKENEKIRFVDMLNQRK